MMNSARSSTSSLSELDALRAQLEEKDNTIQTAAQYGKDLLDQNRELSQNLDDTNSNYTKQIESLKEENYSMSQRLQQKERMEREYFDEIDSLKKHLSSQREELKVLRGFADSSSLLSDTRCQLREAEAASDKLECENKQLQALVSSYERQIREVDAKVKAMQESLSEASSEDLSGLMSELSLVTEHRDELVRSCRANESEIASLTQQTELHVNQISSLQEELYSANSQVSDLTNSYMAATQENQELRGEIDVMRMNDRDHKTKGNSMFTELDDKRQEAEKKLLLLNVKYESLLNQYDLNKKQMSKLKIQMSNILRMASGQVGCDHVTDLENQLVEAHNQIRQLNSRLARTSAAEGAEGDSSQPVEGSMFAGSDRKTLEFVERLLKSKNDEISVMTKELDEKRLAATYSNQQLNDVQHRLRSMESKVNSLHSQNIQLSVKLDDLKNKYEDEGTPNARLVRRRVEDIPDFNPEMAQALLAADSAPVSADSEATNEEDSEETRSLSVADDLQSTLSDKRSLSELQNIDHTPTNSPTTPPIKSQALSKIKSPVRPSSQVKDSLYYSKRTPGSSTDSLVGGKASVKSCDPVSLDDERKVIDVKVDEQNPNNCQTQ
ncbi:protein Spindly-B-like isoform X2 [Watersipora subatra]|uniref:protein Spindly-B-like isoform X2 n=1 Tax=Watersipora subatra TaxID=2589382 RepID=UPI00355B8297